MEEREEVHTHAMSDVNISSLEESTLLAIQAQISEIEELYESRKGKAREDQATDADISLRLFAEELDQQKQTLNDHILSRRVGYAMHHDNSGDDAEILAKCEMPEHEEAHHHQAARIMLKCEACNDDYEFVDVLHLKCDHIYCKSCVQNLFEASMTDESLFPPRCCCQPIAIEDITALVTPGIVERFYARKVEMETPNRTYCSSSLCSSFVHPENIKADLATCQKCGATTCAICKAESHAGDCPNDPVIQDLRKFSSKQGWKTCFNCNRIIELTVGCNHIT